MKLSRPTNFSFLIIAFLCGVLALHAIAQDTPIGKPLSGITYSYSKTPNINESLGDAELKVLLDGDLKTRVAWSRVAPFVDVDFDLKQPRKLSEVTVTTNRPKPNYWVTKIGLYLDSGQGFQLVDVVETGQTFKDEIKESYQTYRFTTVNKSATRARIRFEGRSFIISDVQFFGEGTAADDAPLPAPKNAAPIMKNLYQLPAKTDAATIKATNLDKDSDTEILLGNRYLQVVLEPALGGVISAIKTPSGMEFTPPKSKENPGGGLLGDHVTEQTYRDGDWTSVPYEYEIVTDTPEKVAVKLWRRGASGALGFINLAKTITLHRDRSDIQVDYEITNEYESLVPLSYHWWFHNFAGSADWKKPGALKYFYPMASGVEALDPSVKNNGNDYQQGPRRGWTGFVDTARQAGLAFKMEYRYLASFYNFWSDNSTMPTLEWRFLKFPINNGDTFKTQVILQPFQGLAALSGVSEQAVGDVEYSGAQLRAQIVPNFSGKAELELRWKKLPETKWQTLKQQPVELKAAERIELAAPLKLEGAGTYVVSAVLRDGEKLLFEMEKPVAQGDSKTLYVLAPESEQYQPPGGSLNLRYVSDEFKTPHVAWAKPYAGGKTKAILFTAHKLDRDIIELAERMDLEFDTSFIYADELTYALGDYVASLSQRDIDEGVKKLFERSPDWQVIVMPGAAFAYLPANYRKQILDKVANEGRGLVIVNPDDDAALGAALPVGKRGAVVKNKLWQEVREHAITRGVPFSILPPADVFQYPVKEGEVLAKAGNAPLVVTGAHGKGRVVTLLYRAVPEASNRVANLKVGLMPMMYGNNRDLPATPNVLFAHEYQFSLLAKATLWAARHEPKLVLQEVTVNGRKAQVKFDNTQAATGGKYFWILRDIAGAEQARGESAANFAAGAHSAEIALQNPVARGSIDLWLRDAKGEVYDWGSFPFGGNDKLRLAEVTSDKDVIQSGDTLSFSVALAAAPPANTKIAVQISDGLGRVLRRETVAANGMQSAVRMVLPPLINRALQLRVDLYQNDLLHDTWQKTLPVQFPLKESPHEGEPYMVPWTGFASYTRAVPSYLFDAYFQQMKNIGFNGWMLNPGENVDAVINSALRHDMSLSLKLNGMAGRPLSKESTPARPTLQTSPYDADIIARTLEQGVRGPQKYTQFGAFETVAGDENNLSRGGEDVSFDAEYLKAFRAWLQTRYKSLDELNARWETKFANWDAVEPITLRALRATGTRNFTRWSDFRAFGDVTFTQFFARETQAALKINPRYRLTISGTQYPGPYNGYDYWLLSKNLNSLIAYFGVEEMVSFDTERKIDIRQWASAIRDGGREVKYSIYDRYFRGVTGLNFYTDSLLVRPDLSLSSVGRNYEQAFKPFKEGMARMLITSQFQHSTVALHYSQSSLRIAEALGEYPTWKAMRNASVTLLENTGYTPRWISYEQLADGKLQGLKTLILPFSLSLSKKEADAVRQFAQNGGTVIALMASGQADEYGKLENQGQLDALFGIARGEMKYARGQWALQGSTLDGVSIGLMETGLKATDSEVLASANGQPVIFSAKRGQGRVLYVACDLVSSYEQTNRSRTVKDYAARSAQTEAFLTKLLEESGAQPNFKVLDDKNAPLPFVKTAHFRNGAADYYGLVRDFPIASSLSVQPEKATLQFPKKGYVYGVVSGQQFGFTDRVPLLLAADSAELFAVLPYEVKALNVTTERQKLVLGESAILHFSVEANAKVGNHVLRVDVIDPAEKISTAYSQNLTAIQGKGALTLPFALNDTKGTWTIRARDLSSGATGEIALQLGAG